MVFPSRGGPLLNDPRQSGIFAPGRYVLALVLACVLCAPTLADWADVDFGGSIEIRGTYDTNPLLTDDDFDFELRRLQGDQTEEDDFLGTLSGDLHLKFPVGSFTEQYIEYSFDVDRYSDLDGENREKHRLQLEPTFHLARQLDLTLGYHLRGENTRLASEYRRADYLEHDALAELRWNVSKKDRLTLAYLYEMRDYDNLSGTPFNDYDGHGGKLSYHHRFTRQTRTVLELKLRTRDYDEDTRDALGDRIKGRDRQENRFEIRAHVTHLPFKKTLLRLGYLYRDNRVSGDFYDYQLHRVYGIWVQQLPWRLQVKSYLHYGWRDYDEQVAQDIVTGPVSGLPEQVFSGNDREDRGTYLLLSLSKQLGKGVSCGVEFEYLNNDTNDDSSEYESQRYSVFLEYQF